MNIINGVRNLLGGGLQGIGSFIQGNPSPLRQQPHTSAETGQQVAQEDIQELLKKHQQGDTPPQNPHYQKPSAPLEPHTTQAESQEPSAGIPEKPKDFWNTVSQAGKEAMGSNNNTVNSDAQTASEAQRFPEHWSTLAQQARQIQQLQTQIQQMQMQQQQKYSDPLMAPSPLHLSPLPQNQLFSPCQASMAGGMGGYAGACGMSMMPNLVNPTPIPDYFTNMFSPMGMGGAWGQNMNPFQTNTNSFNSKGNEMPNISMGMGMGMGGMGMPFF